MGREAFEIGGLISGGAEQGGEERRGGEGGS